LEWDESLNRSRVNEQEKQNKKKRQEGIKLYIFLPMQNFKSDGAIFRLQNKIKTLNMPYTVHSLQDTPLNYSSTMFLFQFALNFIAIESCDRDCHYDQYFTEAVQVLTEKLNSQIKDIVFGSGNSRKKNTWRN
jgi:hypothetical protein